MLDADRKLVQSLYFYDSYWPKSPDRDPTINDGDIITAYSTHPETWTGFIGEIGEMGDQRNIRRFTVWEIPMGTYIPCDIQVIDETTVTMPSTILNVNITKIGSFLFKMHVIDNTIIRALSNAQAYGNADDFFAMQNLAKSMKKILISFMDRDDPNDPTVAQAVSMLTRK